MSAAVEKIKQIYTASYEERPLITIFLAVTGVFLAIYLIFLLATCGNVINLTFFADRNDVFMDFFHSAYDATHGPYTDKNVIYPPFTVMIYSVLGQCIQAFTGDVDAFTMRDSAAGMTIFIIFTLVSVIALIWLSYDVLKNEKRKYRILIIISVILSLPLLFSIDRGNCIVYAVVGSLFFVLYYDSEDWRKRLLAYIALGIAAGLKIYPALFLLLLLKDLRIRELVIAVLVIAVMFFAPFLLFENSLHLFSNILSYTSSTVIGAYTIKDMVALLLPMVSGSVSSIIGWIATFIFLFVTMYIILKKRTTDEWKIMALICCNLSIGFGVGTGYLCLYIVIAVLLFLAMENNASKINKIYASIFAFSLVLLAIPIEGINSVAITTSLKSIVILLFAVVLMISILKNNRENAIKNE